MKVSLEDAKSTSTDFLAPLFDLGTLNQTIQAISHALKIVDKV
jgi:hypothetical protein